MMTNMDKEYRCMLIAMACILEGNDLRRVYESASRRYVRVDYEGADAGMVFDEVVKLCLPTRDRLDDESNRIRDVGKALMDAMDGHQSSEDGSREPNVSSLLEGVVPVPDSNTQGGGFHDGDDSTK